MVHVIVTGCNRYNRQANEWLDLTMGSGHHVRDNGWPRRGTSREPAMVVSNSDQDRLHAASRQQRLNKLPQGPTVVTQVIQLNINPLMPLVPMQHTQAED